METNKTSSIVAGTVVGATVGTAVGSRVAKKGVERIVSNLSEVAKIRLQNPGLTIDQYVSSRRMAGLERLIGLEPKTIKRALAAIDDKAREDFAKIDVDAILKNIKKCKLKSVVLAVTAFAAIGGVIGAFCSNKKS